MNIYINLKRPSLYMFIALFVLITNGSNNVRQKNGKTIINANNLLTEAEKKDSLILLFDGKTFNNWRI